MDNNIAPTTDEVRKAYDDGRGWQQMGHARYVPGEFDLWLEQFRAEAKVEALRDEADRLEGLAYGRTGGYTDAGRHIIARIRDRADAIEAGQPDSRTRAVR